MSDAQNDAVPATLWFHGSVAAAVDAANSNESILMVCLIQDATEGSESHRFESRFTDDEAMSKLLGLNLVALKLVKNSIDGLMFGQIFPVMVVPALYLIRNGLLVDFMNTTVDRSQMLERIERATEGYSQIPPPPPSLTATAPILTASVPMTNDFVEDTTGSSFALTHQATPHPGLATATAPPITTPPIAATASSSASVTSIPRSRTDQAQELKELMNERKLKREKEEREVHKGNGEQNTEPIVAAKQREKDRRSSSKTLTEAQKELADKQNKKLKDQIEKEKREEAEYKRRVKQSLEEDKARRKAERERTRTAATTAARNNPQSLQGVFKPDMIQAQNAGLAQARNDAASAHVYDTSRLSIRLFDGSSIRNTFKATDTLDHNQEENEGVYNIVQLIPPRTFTDESKMLRDLELCPSATLILKVLKLQKTATSSSAYGVTGDGAVPTLLNYGWSALSLAGKVASSAYSTVSYYNPLGNTASSSSGKGDGNDIAKDSASSKKKDSEISYNGNSTNLE
ncbi:hypothetical protein EDD11_003634 [Mortierella claussenii]|nr:hypothetical protein EDD11_003634 [Mortierella claussenii]